MATPQPTVFRRRWLSGPEVSNSRQWVQSVLGRPPVGRFPVSDCRWSICRLALLFVWLHSRYWLTLEVGLNRDHFTRCHYVVVKRLRLNYEWFLGYNCSECIWNFVQMLSMTAQDHSRTYRDEVTPKWLSVPVGTSHETEISFGAQTSETEVAWAQPRYALPDGRMKLWRSFIIKNNECRLKNMYIM